MDLGAGYDENDSFIDNTDAVSKIGLVRARLGSGRPVGSTSCRTGSSGAPRETGSFAPRATANRPVRRRLFVKEVFSHIVLRSPSNRGSSALAVHRFYLRYFLSATGRSFSSCCFSDFASLSSETFSSRSLISEVCFKRPVPSPANVFLTTGESIFAKSPSYLESVSVRRIRSLATYISMRANCRVFGDVLNRGHFHRSRTR